MKEFLFFSKEKLHLPLHESIDVVTRLPEQTTPNYLIANHPDAPAEVYAPEIDWYYRHTQDEVAAQIVAVKTLYDMRAESFEGAQHFDLSRPTGDRLLVISGDERRDLAAELTQEGFTAIWLDPALVLDVTGEIGDLHVSIRSLEKGDTLTTHQIIWFGAPEFALRQSGVYDTEALGLDAALEQARAHRESYAYKNFLSYDATICQYHERLTDVCGKCEEVCPTTAILKIEEERHLSFNPVNCHGCGGCVSVCPSGALDYTQMPMDTFETIADYYHNRIPLIVPEQSDLAAVDLPLAHGVLPLAIPGQKFLSEVHLLTLLQKSGQPVLFYSEVLSKGTADAITIVNEIFERRYGKQAVYYCPDVSMLREAMASLEPIPECRFGMETYGMKKRERFTHRLSHLVGEDDFGVVTTGEHIHYGTVTVNPNACTLCVACVGACSAGALTAHPEDNTLRLNASMCTDCGYCEYVCPEADCITVHHDELHLTPEYFKQVVLAQDELFQCVECGKEFATVKAVEKIANMMAPRFGDDATRIRTLYCCPECKPKVMLRDHLNNQTAGVFHG